MFSGKTTELMRRLKRYNFANYRCVIIRYENDNRYETDRIATHDRQSLPAVLCRELKHLQLNYDNFDVIGIDEGQFVSTSYFVICHCFLTFIDLMVS